MGATWRTFWPETPPAADLVNWLVRLWRMPDIAESLRSFFALQCQPVVTPPTDPVDVPEYPADAPPELVRAVREQRASAAKSGDPTEAMGDLVNRLPSLNGKHHAKREG